MHIMFRDKSSSHVQHLLQESGEQFLAEEEGTRWTEREEEETPTCKSFTTNLLQVTALGLAFLIGTLFGFRWRGDLDGLCSRHVSQYCEIYQKLLG